MQFTIVEKKISEEWTTASFRPRAVRPVLVIESPFNFGPLDRGGIIVYRSGRPGRRDWQAAVARDR